MHESVYAITNVYASNEKKFNIQVNPAIFIMDSPIPSAINHSYGLRLQKINGARLGVGFEFSPEDRRLFYTANATESLNRELRKVAKTRPRSLTRRRR